MSPSAAGELCVRDQGQGFSASSDRLWLRAHCRGQRAGEGRVRQVTSSALNEQTCVLY